MLFTKAAIMSIIYFLPISLAAYISPLSIEGQSVPDRWFHMILDEPVANTSLSVSETRSDLEKRTPITACGALQVTTNCLVIANIVLPLVKSIAGGIKELSNQHDCRVMSGLIDGISWSYHSTGAHCDTTAQLDTIAGAIKKYPDKSEHYKVCGTQCLRLDHGGTWNGWLKFGPAEGFNKNAYCGPGLSFSGCISGGNNDI
ncbi:uncharacterized protein N7515_004048 [Penicillium bovifimosum]|uniref:Secreted protein CSS2 C-terminal domain-containing protein n=1 Tax=Penicillium bovifimosum TaxID=126998 RepID=A0A9W9L6T4_9EURO|nr:uncharacterized protein N7515_004048 [Penicillium bovifimosum]KAJ5139200.1 hypothetical protein N7515_004048 [Penicillium bovifimosum]